MSMNLRLSEDAEKALKNLSESSGESKTKIIEKLVLESARQEKLKQRFNSFAEEVTVGKDDLMERLRDA